MAALCALAAFPTTVIAATSWVWQPTWAGGRALVTAVWVFVMAGLFLLASKRRRRVRVERGSTLTWETGIESDDPYSVALHQNGSRELLIEDSDPARVLADARRVARETGAVLLGPEWVSEQRSALRAPATFAPSIQAEGLVWPHQLRASRTTVLGGLFVLVLSAGSIRAESEVSLLSAALPGISVVLALIVGAFLAKLRVFVEAGPEGLRAERRGVGAPRTILTLPLASVLDVNAVGHPSHPETHLLIETLDGPVSLNCAEETARGVARSWAASACRPAGAA